MRTILFAFVLIFAAGALAVKGLAPSESESNEALNNWSMQEEYQQMSDAQRR